MLRSVNITYNDLRERQIYRKTVTLFETLEEGMEFIEDYGSNGSRADILEKMGRYSEAADIQMLEGNIGSAVRLFLLAKNVESSRQAAHCVLSRLWELFSFGAPLGINDEALELLRLCSKVDQSHLTPLASTQVSKVQSSHTNATYSWFV